MKKYIIIALSLICLLSACGKKKKFEQIDGVDFFDLYNNPEGSLGTANSYRTDSELALHFFPVPTTTMSPKLILENKSDISKSYQVKIVNAQFKNAPAFIPEVPIHYVIGQKLNIENLGGKPDEVLLTMNLSVDAGSYRSTYIDINNYKQGFYRIIVEVDGERKYWNDFWIIKQ